MDEGRPAPDENAGMRLPRQTGQGLQNRIARTLNLPENRTSAWDMDTDRKYLAWVNFIEPAPGKDTLHAVTGSVPTLAKGSRKKERKTLGELSESKQNLEIYHRLRNALQNIRREEGTELLKVKVTDTGHLPET